jgi:glutathione S-transferase
MILYGAPAPAPNPRRVRIFIAEKGIDLPETPLSLMAREHKSDEHKARNSLGQVPTLELDDGETINETVAICRYLEELNPTPPLFGKTPLERAKVEMWTRRIELSFGAPVGQYWRHAHPYTAQLIAQFIEFGQSNQAIYNTNQEWLDSELKGREFVATADYTIADICAQTTIDFATWIGLPIRSDLPNLLAWHARVSARPSAKA